MNEILEQLSKAFGGSSSGNYRSRKSLDDPFKTEGDTAFLRMNARLRPNQLKPGEVALSQNGRMNKDGTWQVRKGLSTLAGAITVGADSLRLPFPIASAQRTSNVVTLTLSDTPSLDFVPTENLTVVNLGYSAADPNGTFALSSVDFSNGTVTYPSAGGDESFTIVGADANRPSVTSPGDSIRTTLNFNLADDEVNAVYGSAVFSDPSADNDDFIFTATNSLCLILRLRDSAEFKVRYEAGGESVDRPVDVVQSFDKMFIFRTTKTTLEATPVLTRKDITLAARSSNVITITAATHGRVANDYVTLTGLGGWTTDPNDVYKVVSATTNTFTVVQAGANESFNTSGAFAEYFSDFTRVSYGAYTAPTYKTDANEFKRFPLQIYLHLTAPWWTLIQALAARYRSLSALAKDSFTCRPLLGASLTSAGCGFRIGTLRSAVRLIAISATRSWHPTLWMRILMTSSATSFASREAKAITWWA